MRVLIIGLIICSCLVLVGCSTNDSPAMESVGSMPSSGINIFKEYYINYSIVDISPAKCRWFNRDDMSYGAFNLTRFTININGESTGTASDVIGGTLIDYVKHFSRDENYLMYDSIDAYAVDRFVDGCFYFGVLYIDSMVCVSVNNNSTVCYNLSGTCDLDVSYLDEGNNYVLAWSRTNLDLAIEDCIRDFDMVVDK